MDLIEEEDTVVVQEEVYHHPPAIVPDAYTPGPTQSANLKLNEELTTQFVQDPHNTWRTNEEPSEKVYAYCRRKLNECKFQLNHPPPAGWHEMTLITLRAKITEWEYLLGKAAYN